MVAITLLFTLCFIESNAFTDISMSFKNPRNYQSPSKVKREIIYNENDLLDEIFPFEKFRKTVYDGDMVGQNSEKVPVYHDDTSDITFDGPVSSFPNNINHRNPKTSDSESDFVFPDDPRLKKTKTVNEIHQANDRQPINSYGQHNWNNIINQWQWVQNDGQKPNHLNNFIYPPERPNPCQLLCHQWITMEYNPICGSDGVTYYNPGKFKCARQCGRNISGQPYKTCGLLAPKI